MNIDKAFPSSNLLNAEDIAGKRVKVVIRRVSIEQVGGQELPVMSFVNKEKKLKLNRTNMEVIKESMGPETGNWHGATLLLYTEKVQFQGKRVLGIRLEVLDKPAAGYVPDDSDDAGSDDGDDLDTDDIPF